MMDHRCQFKHSHSYIIWPMHSDINKTLLAILWIEVTGTWNQSPQEGKFRLGQVKWMTINIPIIRVSSITIHHFGTHFIALILSTSHWKVGFGKVIQRKSILPIQSRIPIMWISFLETRIYRNKNEPSVEIQLNIKLIYLICQYYNRECGGNSPSSNRCIETELHLINPPAPSGKRGVRDTS